MICRICQAQRKSAPSAKDAFCNASSVRDRMGGFLQYCGRALRARSLRFLIPPIEALKAQRHLAKTSISFAGAGAKTCGLNALAHNLYIARIAQGQNQVLGEFPIHIVFAHGAETKPSPCRRLSLCFCFTLRMAKRMYIFGFDSA